MGDLGRPCRWQPAGREGSPALETARTQASWPCGGGPQPRAGPWPSRLLCASVSSAVGWDVTRQVVGKRHGPSVGQGRASYLPRDVTCGGKCWEPCRAGRAPRAASKGGRRGSAHPGVGPTHLAGKRRGQERSPHTHVAGAAPRLRERLSARHSRALPGVLSAESVQDTLPAPRVLTAAASGTGFLSLGVAGTRGPGANCFLVVWGLLLWLFFEQSRSEGPLTPPALPRGRGFPHALPAQPRNLVTVQTQLTDQLREGARWVPLPGRRSQSVQLTLILSRPGGRKAEIKASAGPAPEASSPGLWTAVPSLCPRTVCPLPVS